MTAKDAISSQIAPLRSSMPLTEASVLMREMHRRSLPVVDSDGDYVGMFNEPYESSSDSAMGCVGDFLVEYDAVGGTYPLLMLLESMVSGRRSIVPVVEDGTDVFIGAVDRDSVLEAVAKLFPQIQESTELTVTCTPGNYSASAIAHAVEDVDAHLLNLNVVEGTEPMSRTTVMLRVNHSRGESVARSLACYGYDTVEMTGRPGAVNQDMVERVNALLHYLDV